MAMSQEKIAIPILRSNHRLIRIEAAAQQPKLTIQEMINKIIAEYFETKSKKERINFEQKN